MHATARRKDGGVSVRARRPSLKQNVPMRNADQHTVAAMFSSLPVPGICRIEAQKTSTYSLIT
eukprot:10171970-Alexandrium_andersonii.AAC.1